MLEKNSWPLSPIGKGPVSPVDNGIFAPDQIYVLTELDHESLSAVLLVPYD